MSSTSIKERSMSRRMAAITTTYDMSCDSDVVDSMNGNQKNEPIIANINQSNGSNATRIAASPRSCSNNNNVITTEHHHTPTSLHRLRRSTGSTKQKRKMNLYYCAPSLALQLLIIITLTSSLTTLVSAQTTTTVDKECSCSPQIFVFKLALSATCPPLPPPFPPNDVFGGGVKDYTCSISPEPIPNAASQEPVTSEDEEVDATADSDGSVRRRKMTGLGEYDETAMDFFPEAFDTDEIIVTTSVINKDEDTVKNAADIFPEINFTTYEVIPIEELEWSSVNFTASGNVIEPASSVDTQPVSIYSIQFLEVDKSFNVINQDSSYVRGIDLVNGDVFNYTSISAKPVAQTLGVVPGGMNMVLRGVNAAGEPVRNVFTITYTNDCGVPTFEDGNAIGWVVFENSVPATEESCGRSLTPAPIPGPSSKPNAPSPPSPTPPSGDGGWGSPATDGYMMEWGGGSPSSKGSKMWSKSGKSAKSSKAKSSKSWSHKSTEDGSSWNGPRSSVDMRTQYEPVRRGLRRVDNDVINEDANFERRSLGRRSLNQDKR